MTTTCNPSFVFSPNPKSPFTERFRFADPTRTKLFKGASISGSRTLAVKCSDNGSEQRGIGSLKDALSVAVDERVEELLNREENKTLLDGLEKATLRVEMAKRELAEIEKQEIEVKQLRDYINLLETRASEVTECQKEILEARAMIEEAERSLGIDGAGNRDSLSGMASNAINKNEEKLESIKAAFIAAAVGTLACLPFALTRATNNSELILPLTITVVSCALFGITFRYAVRRDLDNFQLKSGTSAAFGIVKGLGALGCRPPLEFDAGSLSSLAFSGAINISENLLIFIFAVVGLDVCIMLRILSPFPTERPVSKTTR